MGESVSAPFFIVGASRSGTTMLRLILNAHSRLVVPRELKYFSRLPLAVGDTNWRDADPAKYRTLVDRFVDSRKELFDDIDLDGLVGEMKAVTPPDYRAPYLLAMNAIAQAAGKARWGEKTPFNLYYVDVLGDMFPESRFVYLVRDPRAVVNSMNSIRYYTDDTVFNACNWLQAATTGYDLLRRSVPDERQTVVRYEDLVGAPEETVRRLCAFLGEEYEAAMMEFYQSTRQNMPATIRTALVAKPVDEQNAEKWRSELSPNQIAVIEMVCGDAMRAFNYELDGARAGVVARGEAQIKQNYWSWQRRRNASARLFEVQFRMFGRFR